MSPAARSSSTVRAVTVPRFGGPDVLQIAEVPAPGHSEGSVVVKVSAAAVSNTDVLLRSGAQKRYLSGVPFPYVPGMDLAGTIHASSHPQWPVGTRVMGAVSAWREEGGAQAELVSVPVESLAPSPFGLSDVEASTLPMNGLTAVACVAGLRLQAGRTVAVLGAAGAVGGLAVQIAKMRGLRVIADASPADEGLVMQLGADLVVPRGDRLREAVHEHARRGVAGVIDAAVIGQRAVDLLADHGSLVTVRPQLGLRLDRGIIESQVFVPMHLASSGVLRELSAFASSGDITARVAEEFTPDRAHEAHELLGKGGVRGRPVLNFASW